MKLSKTLIIMLFMFVANPIMAQSTFDKWPEIKTFHEVMSQTFHPSEEGNLQPIKSRYEELASKAEMVFKSEIPAEFKTKSIVIATEKLQLNTKALQKKIITKATDAEITTLLSEVHDVFHEIVGLCANGER